VKRAERVVKGILRVWVVEKEKVRGHGGGGKRAATRDSRRAARRPTAMATTCRRVSLRSSSNVIPPSPIEMHN